MSLPPLPDIEQAIYETCRRFVGADVEEALVEIMQSYAKLAVREALTRAAEVCDSEASCELIAQKCADLIRAIIKEYE